MTRIGAALQAVYERVISAAAAASRHPNDIKLVAVTKGVAPDAIREAYEAGQKTFGESYVQEALGKIETLRDLALEWHFIGPIQRNKTRPIAEHFSWVHGVDRLQIAKRLSEARPSSLPPLQTCLQVNISGEHTKGGVAPADVLELARQIAALPNLQLRGLMAIPAPTSDFNEQRRSFARLSDLRTHLQGEGIMLDTLSMGMSADLEAAIAEGATMVRIGTAIFGERLPPR